MLDCRPWHPLLVKLAAGIGWCKIGNGGCWQETQDGKIYSACLPKGCHCPPGFKGDGVNNCEDIDECKEKLVCQCSDCSCKNTWGSYECNCEAGHLYIREHDTCISILSAPSKSGWTTVSFVIFAMVAASVGAYVVYKYRLRIYLPHEASRALLNLRNEELMEQGKSGT